MILLVSYDLKKPDRDYNPLYSLLKTAPSWWHYLESTWIIRTNETVQAWADKIRTVVDPSDYVIIIDITNKPRQGWLPMEAWEWIKDQEPIT